MARIIWKPTADECKRIRAAAVTECRMGGLKLEAGTRCYTGEGAPRDSHVNIAMVTDEPVRFGWNDTDLEDFMTWPEFKTGIELTPDGRAIVDFYCYSRDSLESNITVYYADGAIEHIDGTSIKDI